MCFPEYELIFKNSTIYSSIALDFTPKKLLEMIGVTKEVVFSGNDYKIEIWAKENYESSIISNEDFISIAGSLSETI